MILFYFSAEFYFHFACRSTQPKPDKAILNLTTQIDSLRFCPGGELLGLASISKEAAVKLLHTPTMTVYQNFPGQYKHLGKVHFIKPNFTLYFRTFHSLFCSNVR